jgi:hypothetical protein
VTCIAERCRVEQDNTPVLRGGCDNVLRTMPKDTNGNVFGRLHNNTLSARRIQFGARFQFRRRAGEERANALLSAP